MKRTAFGIKVIVNGVPDGSLTWSDRNYDSYYNLRFNCDNCTGPDKLEYSQIFTFSEVYDCWKSEEVCTEDFTIYFTWTRANGYKQYFDEKITVKRNVMTTIGIVPWFLKERTACVFLLTAGRTSRASLLIIRYLYKEVIQHSCYLIPD